MSTLEHFTTPDGLTIAYRDEGDGLPLIALSGLTRNHRDFDFVAPHLENVRLIRPDYRGRGASDWADWTTYTVPNEAGDVLALMAHLELDRAAFLGTSRGGLIAMAIAATQPDRVIGVCLNDVGPVVERKGLAFIDTYIGRVPQADTIAEMAEIRARSVQGFDGVPHARWIEEVERTYHDEGHGLALNYDPALRESFLAAMSAELPDLWPFFDALAAKPVAALRGASSDVLSQPTLDEMQARRPDMLSAVIANRGHAPFLDEPEALAVLKTWISLCQ